jgi:hypothetical protein
MSTVYRYRPRLTDWFRPVHGCSSKPLKNAVESSKQMLSCFFVWVLSDFHFLEKFWNFDKVKNKRNKNKNMEFDKFFQLQAYRPIHEQQMCTAKLHWGLAQPAFRSGCFAHSVNRTKVLFERRKWFITTYVCCCPAKEVQSMRNNPMCSQGLAQQWLPDELGAVYSFRCS